jgi:hypothetical protein
MTSRPRSDAKQISARRRSLPQLSLYLAAIMISSRGICFHCGVRPRIFRTEQVNGFPGLQRRPRFGHADLPAAMGGDILS